MVYKRCPECQQWIPVACKTCPCGHAFSGRKSSTSSFEKKVAEEVSLEPKQRRTERTKRQRPDFFNALEFETHMRKVSRRRTESNKSEDNSETPKKQGRGRPKGSGTKAKTAPEVPAGDGSSNSSTPAQSVSDKDIEKDDENLYTNLPLDKLQQYSIILSEINRKFCGQNFQPV